MITKRAKKVLTITALCACVSGGVFGGAFWYVAKQGDVLQERAQAVADNATQAQTYQALERLLEESVDERNQLQTYILNESATIDFLSDIETIAAQSGVVITTDTLTVTEATNFDTLLVQFTLEGETSDVAAVIQILETLPYKSHVDSLTIATRPDEEPPVTAVVQLAVSLAKI